MKPTTPGTSYGRARSAAVKKGQMGALNSAPGKAKTPAKKVPKLLPSQLKAQMAETKRETMALSRGTKKSMTKKPVPMPGRTSKRK